MDLLFSEGATPCLSQAEHEMGELMQCWTHRNDHGSMLNLVGSAQTTEVWDRRVVAARDEHGLLEWELETTGDKADPADQLLRSPMPGIAAMLCTREEISARRQLLVSEGFLQSMRKRDSPVESAPEADRPSNDGEPGSKAAPPQPIDEAAAQQENRGIVTADNSSEDSVQLQVLL